MKKGGILLFVQVDRRRLNRWEKVVCPFFGFSLLEIVLALAILAGALAALGEVMRSASQSAALASDETQAQLLAESVMAELLAGARPTTAVNGAAFDLAIDPPWVYSIAIEPTPFQELIAVRVSVAQQLAPEMQPARCDLVRWLLSPDFITAQATAQAKANAAQATESSSSGSTPRRPQGGQQNGGQSTPGSPNQIGGGD